MKKSREELKEKFVTGAKPQEVDYHNALDSYVHKDELAEAVEAMDLKGEPGENAHQPMRGTYVLVNGAVEGAPTEGVEVGDTINVVDRSESPATMTQYRWDGAAWVDTGVEVSVGEARFKDGPEVGLVEIVDDLERGGPNNVPSAEAVKGLKDGLYGKTTLELSLEDLIATGHVSNNYKNNWYLNPGGNNLIVGYSASGVNTLYIPTSKFAEIKSVANTLRIIANATRDTYLCFATATIDNRDYSFQELEDAGLVCEGVTAETFITAIPAGQTMDITIPSNATRCYISNKISGSIYTRIPQSVRYWVEQHTPGDLDNLDIDVVDNLASSDADKALSARQGKVLKESMDAKLGPNYIDTGIDYSEFIVWDTNKYIKSSGEPKTGTYGQKGYTDYIPVENIKGLICTAPSPHLSGSTKFYAGYWYDENKAVLADGTIGNANAKTAIVCVKPEGAAFVRFNVDEGCKIVELKAADEVFVPSAISGYEALNISVGAKVGNVPVFQKMSGKNLCNPDDVLIQTGLYIEASSGKTWYTSSSSTPKGVTGFIKMNGKSLVCNNAVAAGSYGTVCYDENFQRTHGSSSTAKAIYQDGDMYAKFTLGSVTDVQVEYGTLSTDYEPYEEYHELNQALLPTGGGNTAGGGIYDGVRIVAPSTIYLSSGDSMRLYHRSIIHAANPACVQLGVAASSPNYISKEFPRYVEVTGAGVLNLALFDNNCNAIATKSIRVVSVPTPQSPLRNINILAIGASRIAGGETLQELLRRLTGSGGTPAGNNLQNIRLVGRKGSGGIYHEAESGEPMMALVQGSDLRYNIQTEPGTNAGIGNKYTYTHDSYAWVLQVTGSEPQDGKIHFKKISGNGTFNDVFADISSENPGTLTLQGSGGGDSTIVFTSIDQTSTNPLWYNGTIDFGHYAASQSKIPLVDDEKIDILILSRTANDISDMDNEDWTVIDIVAAWTTIAEAFNNYNPNGKVIFALEPLPSPLGGLAHGNTPYSAPKGFYWHWANVYYAVFEKLMEEATTRDYVTVAPVYAEFDGENLYPSDNVTVTKRSSVTEKVQNNALHYVGVAFGEVADVWYHAVCKCINEIIDERQ